jgi:hypothetical protein
MTLDPELVRAGRRLRDRLAELGVEVDRVQADLRGQVGLMRAAGGSPAEIAAAVGLSEQQIRELLPIAPGDPPAAAESPSVPRATQIGTAKPRSNEAGAVEARAADADAAGVGVAENGAALEADAAALLEELDEAEDVDLGGPSRPAAAVAWVTLSCAFCGASQGNVSKLIAGPGVAICDGCARLALDVLVEGESESGALALVGGDPRDRFRCSFCGKRSRRVGRLVTGSGGVHICGECLDLCNEILREELGR